MKKIYAEEVRDQKVPNENEKYENAVQEVTNIFHFLGSDRGTKVKITWEFFCPASDGGLDQGEAIFSEGPDPGIKLAGAGRRTLFSAWA